MGAQEVIKERVRLAAAAKAQAEADAKAAADKEAARKSSILSTPSTLSIPAPVSSPKAIGRTPSGQLIYSPPVASVPTPAPVSSPKAIGRTPSGQLIYSPPVASVPTPAPVSSPKIVSPSQANSFNSIVQPTTFDSKAVQAERDRLSGVAYTEAAAKAKKEQELLILYEQQKIEREKEKQRQEEEQRVGKQRAAQLEAERQRKEREVADALLKAEKEEQLRKILLNEFISSYSTSSRSLQPTISNPQKIKSNITIKSKESEIIDFNTLQVPNPNIKLIYNFYEKHELDVDYSEDPLNDPLLNTDIHHTPRYLNMKWDIANVVDLPELNLELKAEQEIKKNIYFGNPQNNANPISTPDGPAEYVDTHNLPLGFDSVSNGSNSVNSTALMGNNSSTARINFSLGGFSQTFIDSTDNNMSSVAENISQITSNRVGSKMFNSSKEFIGMDYVGYVIEKERLDKLTGQWDKIDEYKILGSNVNIFRDSRIAYGQIYRYRMKSIVKFTSPQESKETEGSKYLEDPNFNETKTILSDITNNEQILDNLSLFLANGMQNKGFEDKYSIELGSYTLECDGSIINIYKTFDLQKNIISSKNLLVDPRLLDKNVTNDELKEIFNEMGALDLVIPSDEDVKKYVSQYFSSNTSKEWTYVAIVSNDVAEYPSYVMITPNSDKKEIMIYWQYPNDSKRNVKYFNIYRKELNNGNLKWIKIGQAPKEDNIFIDNNIDFEIQYAYAITSVTIRGLESFLSAQIGVQLNKNYDQDKAEKELFFVSAPGAIPIEANLRILRELETPLPIIVKRSINLKVASSFIEDDKKFIIRVKSLDTHQQQDIKLILKNINISIDKGIV